MPSVQDASRDMLGLDRAVDALDQEREFVAAEARSRVRTAQARADPGRDLDKQGVAGGMTERVVDAFEIVDVEEDHGDARGPFRTAAQGLLDLLSEERAVGEIRERVVVRLVGQLFLELRQSRDRSLHAAVLEDGRRPRREGPEEAKVS